MTMMCNHGFVLFRGCGLVEGVHSRGYERLRVRVGQGLGDVHACSTRPGCPLFLSPRPDLDLDYPNECQVKILPDANKNRPGLTLTWHFQIKKKPT